MKIMKKIVLLIFCFVLIVISACGNNAANYTISEKLVAPFDRFNGNVLNEINYGQEKLTLELVVGDEKNYDDQLKVNGKTIDLRFMEITEIQIIDNIIIFATHGSDDLSTTLYAFNMDGEKLLEISDIDNNGMRIYNNYDVSGAFQIMNDKITIRGSRLYLGTDLKCGDSESIILTHDGVDWTADVPEDEIIRANYEINYLGGGKFGEITKTETTMTYAQLKQSKN